MEQNTFYELVQITDNDSRGVMLVDEPIAWIGRGQKFTFPLVLQNIGLVEIALKKLNKAVKGLGFSYGYREVKFVRGPVLTR